MKICIICENEFYEVRCDQKYCSLTCRKVNKNVLRRKDPIKYNCVICDTEFTQKRKDNVTCSNLCSQKLWVKNNPEKNKLRQKNAIPHNKRNPDGFKLIQRRYKDKKRLTDPVYCTHENIANLIRNAIKKVGTVKMNRTVNILGCTVPEFRDHLETQFEPWMNWDNYGLYNGELNYGWDIDHIEPLFPSGIVRCENDIIRLNHHTNLRPLCSKINRDVKKNKIKFGC